MNESDEFKNLVVGNRICSCGNRYDYMCPNSKCEHCCQNTTCEKHVRAIINRAFEMNKCSCGNFFNYMCKYDKCGECCENKNCREHEKIIEPNVSNIYNCSCNGFVAAAVACTNRLCKNCCEFKGARDCNRHKSKGAAKYIATRENNNSSEIYNSDIVHLHTHHGKNIMNHKNNIFYKCKSCKKNLCNACVPSYTRDILCEIVNCKNCNNGICPNITMNGYYCIACFKGGTVVHNHASNDNECSVCNNKIILNNYWKCDECNRSICDDCDNIIGHHQTILCSNEKCHLCQMKANLGHFSYNHCGKCFGNILLSHNANTDDQCIMNSYNRDRVTILSTSSVVNIQKIINTFLEQSNTTGKCECGQIITNKCIKNLCVVCCKNLDCPEHCLSVIENRERIKTQKCICGLHFNNNCTYKMCKECCNNMNKKCHTHIICNICKREPRKLSFRCEKCDNDFCYAGCDACHDATHIKCERNICWYCDLHSNKTHQVQYKGTQYCTACYYQNENQLRIEHHSVCSECKVSILTDRAWSLECRICVRKICNKCVTRLRYLMIRRPDGTDICCTCNSDRASRYESDFESEYESDFELSFESRIDRLKIDKSKHDDIIKLVHNKDYDELQKECDIKIDVVAEFDSKYDKVTECPICYEKVDCQISCGHIFCLECHIKERLFGSKKCAICREKFKDDIFVIL